MTGRLVVGEVARLEGVGEGDPGEVAKGEHEAEAVRGDVHRGEDGSLLSEGGAVLSTCMQGRATARPRSVRMARSGKRASHT